MMPAVRFDNVVKRFNEHVALEHVTLDVPAGQRVAIIGPSGSGKTTLLRLAMTLERPDEGTISIEGELLGMRRKDGRYVPDSGAHLRSVRGKVGMVFQHSIYSRT